VRREKKSEKKQERDTERRMEAERIRRKKGREWHMPEEMDIPPETYSSIKIVNKDIERGEWAEAMVAPALAAEVA